MKINQIITENFNGEYDDEAGMVKSNLYTIAKAAQGLLDTIEDHDNLPEWVQEKIATAKGMLVGVMDYMISQHEQGIQPTVDQEPDGMAVAEDASGGGTSSGGMATSMGGSDGFGKSIFMSRKGPVKSKKSKK